MSALQAIGYVFVVGGPVALIAAIFHYDGWRKGLAQGRLDARIERETDEHERGLPQ